MNRPRIRHLALTLLGAGLIATASGCGSSGNVDVAKGRSLFISSCGTCHALQQAATTADIGPNLDAAFAAARDSGQDSDTIQGVVSAQIANPRETDPSDPTYMPADIVNGQAAEDVSAYVASVAGVPGAKPPTAPGGPGGQVFASNGCAACHTMAAAQSAGNVGPNFDEALPGQSASMIRQSIVDPQAKITAGFPSGVMPANYGDSIDPKDLDLLVNFLATCSGQGTSAPGAPNLKFAPDGSCAGASSGAAGGGGSGGGSSKGSGK